MNLTFFKTSYSKGLKLFKPFQYLWLLGICYNYMIINNKREIIREINRGDMKPGNQRSLPFEVSSSSVTSIKNQKVLLYALDSHKIEIFSWN